MPASAHPSFPSLNLFPLVLQRQGVRGAMRTVNLRKAARPDRVPNKNIKVCTDQLAKGVIVIINIYQAQSVILHYFNL